MKKVGVNRVDCRGESQQVYATKMNLHTHLNICNRGLSKDAGFAILPNKIDKITGKFKNIDKAKSQWVFRQH
jgi:hypothetical protein